MPAHNFSFYFKHEMNCDLTKKNLFVTFYFSIFSLLREPFRLLPLPTHFFLTAATDGNAREYLNFKVLIVVCHVKE